MAARSSQDVDGYFLPELRSDNDESDDDDDGSDDDEMIDFSDPNVYCEESSHVQGSSLKRRKFSFKEYKTGKIYNIDGRPQFSDPWWAATIHVNRGRGLKKRMVGYPAYKLRSDPQVAKDRIVILLMRACKVHHQHAEAFHNFVCQNKLENHLTFDRLPDLLGKFAAFGDEQKDIADTINKQIKQGSGYFVWLSFGLEELFASLPQLLPRHFIKILAQHSKKLPALQESLQNKPWVFAFAKILGVEHNLFGCEAQLSAMEISGLIKRFPPDITDALHIYDVLKKVTRSGGHTFTHRAWLPRCGKFDGYIVKNWPNALQFLEGNEIIVQENKAGKDRVYLMREWSAEAGIADGVHTLHERHKEDPWTFNLDFRSPSFSGIRKDADQVHACKLISQKPVVVLSGKGGCGKTTVVSAVIQHAEKSLKRRQMQQFQRQMFAFDDSDEEILTQTAHEVEQSILEGRDPACEQDQSICYDFEPASEQREARMEAKRDATNPKVNNMIASGVDRLLAAAADEDKLLGSNSDIGASQSPKEDLKGSSLSPKKDLKGTSLSAKKDLKGTSLSPKKDLKGTSQSPKKDPKGTSQSPKKGPKVDIKSKEDCPVILLTAPTGKAANHLGKKSHIPAFTLHQVIYSYWNWKKKNDQESDWKFSKVQALVVDECSLVSVATFHAMFDALLQESPLKKIVLLGDINQLPSIEPGNFLSDLHKSLTAFGCATFLRHNHRSEAQLIVDNAGRIADQKIPLINGADHFYQVNLDELMTGHSEDDLSVLQDQAVRTLLAQNIPDLGGHKNSQFVAFRRRDCAAINEICCKHYVGHTTKNAKNRLIFQPGDKVCCTKNHEVTDEQIHENAKEIKDKSNSISETPSKSSSHPIVRPSESASESIPGNQSKKNETSLNSNGEQNVNASVGEKKKSCPKRRLCNGEIFFIKHDVTIKEPGKRDKRILTLEDEDGKLISVDYLSLRRDCKLRHAWARTIHTYQGSESNTVIYVVGSPGGQTWQHVYTAVTRGKLEVIMITRQSHLVTAIACKPQYRYTSLNEKVTEALGKIQTNTKMPTFIKASELMSSTENSPTRFRQNLSNSPAYHAQPKYGINNFTSLNPKPVANRQSTSLLETPSQHLPAKDSLSSNNSQTFSDWGDDIVDNLFDLENGLLDTNIAKSVPGPSMKNPQESQNFVSSEKRKLESLTPVSVVAPGPTESCNSSSHSRSNPRRNLFYSSKNEMDQLLDDIHESPEYNEIPLLTESQNTQLKRCDTGSSWTSPKRPLASGNYQSHKSRCYDYHPITNSEVSPLRKGLLGINILEDSQESVD